MAVAQPNKRELDLNSDQRFPKFISTWNFGKAVNDAALKAHNQTGQLLDAIEQGIWVAEADASNGSVGLGGHTQCRWSGAVGCLHHQWP